MDSTPVRLDPCGLDGLPAIAFPEGGIKKSMAFLGKGMRCEARYDFSQLGQV